MLAPEEFLRGGLNTREITFVREPGVTLHNATSRSLSIRLCLKIPHVVDCK